MICKERCAEFGLGGEAAGRLGPDDLLTLAQHDQTVWLQPVQLCSASALLSSSAGAEKGSAEGDPLSRRTAIHATGTARGRRLEAGRASELTAT